MIVDAFTFFNEKELVELRVKYLNDIVDCFLVAEADHTHTGIKKNWNYTIQQGKKSLNFIIPIIIKLNLNFNLEIY